MTDHDTANSLMDVHTDNDPAEILADLTQLCSRRAELLEKLLRSRFMEMVSEKMPEAVPLGTLCDEIVAGISYLPASSSSDEGTCVIRGKDIQRNCLDGAHLAHIPSAIAQKYEGKDVRTNDILVRQVGLLGEACIVPSKYKGSLVYHALIVRLKNECGVDEKYVCSYINSSFGRRYVEELGKGKPLHYLSVEALAAMPVVVPSSEDRAILERIERTLEAAQREV